MILKPLINAQRDVRRLFFPVPFVFILVFFSCSGSDKPEVEPLLFTVDSTLLGESFADSASGLSLRAPAGWPRLPDDMIEQVREGIEANQKNADLPLPEILTLFSLQEHNAHLVVGLYDPALSPALEDSVLNRQKEGLQKQFPSDKVLSAKFLHNNNVFEQLLVAGTDFTVIKLFVRREGRGMCQIEYVARRSWYQTHLKSIESSIGSISFKS